MGTVLCSIMTPFPMFIHSFVNVHIQHQCPFLHLIECLPYCQTVLSNEDTAVNKTNKLTELSYYQRRDDKHINKSLTKLIAASDKHHDRNKHLDARE